MKTSTPPTSNANLLTFSAFGARVPGDSAGIYRKSGEYVPPNPALEIHIRNHMVRPAVTFGFNERASLVGELSDFCCKNKIIVGAINARDNHVHALVYCELIPDKELINRFKRAASMRLHKLFPRFLEIEKIWTPRGNVVAIFTPEDWQQCMRYVAERQGDNSYMTQEEWLWRSSIWNLNPFDLSRIRYARFDGVRLTARENPDRE